MLFWFAISDITLALSNNQKASDQKSLDRKMREFKLTRIKQHLLIKTDITRFLYKEKTFENIGLKFKDRKKYQ